MVSATDLTQMDRQALFVMAQQSMSAPKFAQALATAALLPIAEQVIEQAKMRQILTTDRFSVGPSITYNLKKRGGPAVIAPVYGAAPTTIRRYTRISVEPWIIEHAPEISSIDIMDANFNVVQDILDDAGKEVALLEDSQSFALFDVSAPVPGGAFPGSDSFPTYSNPGGAGGRLSSNVVQLQDTHGPTAQNIITTQALLRMIGYEADGLLMNPYSLGKLMATNEFLLYLNFGARDVLEKGYIENALGVKLVTSRLCGQRDIWVMDTQEYARFIERNPLNIESKVERLVNSWFLWERVCVFVRASNATVRLAYANA